MSAASGSAMPGDALYGIKRSQEGAQLALASSDAGKGKLYLEFARTRLGEAEAIKADPSLLKSTLADMDKETRQGVSLLTSDAVAHKNPAALSTIDQFVDRQSGDLNQLLNGVSDDERSMVASSASTVGNAGLRSADVRKVLDCDRVPTVGTDAVRAEGRLGLHRGGPDRHQVAVPARVERSPVVQLRHRRRRHHVSGCDR